MKIQFPFRFISLLLLLNIYFIAHTQVSFLEPDTAVWRFRGFVHHDPCFHYDWQYMLTNQDTTVGMYTYRKMYQLGHQLVYLDCIEPPLGSTSPYHGIPLLKGLIREEGRKVYYWPTSYDSEFLAYDFDQQVGDTVPLYLPAIVTVAAIEEIVLNGNIFKQYILGSIENPIDTFIEGVGTNSFPFLNSLEVVEAVNLVCYSRNDTVYYHRYDSCGFFEHPPDITSINWEFNSEISDTQIIQLIYPNPATNQVNIIFGSIGEYSIDLVDQVGRTWQVQSIQNESEIQVDISSFQSGVYLLYIKNKDILVAIHKLIVLHQ